MEMDSSTLVYELRLGSDGGSVFEEALDEIQRPLVHCLTQRCVAWKEDTMRLILTIFVYDLKPLIWVQLGLAPASSNACATAVCPRSHAR